MASALLRCWETLAPTVPPRTASTSTPATIAMALRLTAREVFPSFSRFSRTIGTMFTTPSASVMSRITMVESALIEGLTRLDIV